PEFERIKEAVTREEENLQACGKVLTKMVLKQGELSLVYTDHSKSIQTLGNMETSITPQMAELAGGLQSFAEALYVLGDRCDDRYLQVILEYEAYVHRVRELLKQRDQKQIDFEALTEYLQSTIDEFEHLKNSYSTGGVASFLNKKLD